MREIFRPIIGYPGYFISNYGRVKSFKKNRELILQTHISRGGFSIVYVYLGRKLVTLYVSRVVLEAFQGFPAAPWLCVAHHKDGDLLNCRLENLEWLICETTDEYDPQKSHRKGVLKPNTTKEKMTDAKFHQSLETIQKAVKSRARAVELRNMKKIQDRLNGK